MTKSIYLIVVFRHIQLQNSEADKLIMNGTHRQEDHYLPDDNSIDKTTSPGILHDCQLEYRHITFHNGKMTYRI